MRAGCEDAARLFICKAGTYRYSAGKTLCKGGDIGLNAEKLGSDKCARPANACLYLVSYGEDIVLAAFLKDSFDKILLERYDTALALNELEHNGADLALILRENSSEVFDIVCLCVHKARNEREEVVMEAVLSCGGEGSHRSAVKAVCKRYNDVSFGIFSVLVKAVFSCDLYSALVSFGAAVAEEYLVIAGSLAKLCGKIGLNFCVVVI